MAEDPVAVLSPLSEADKPRQGGERWGTKLSYSIEHTRKRVTRSVSDDVTSRLPLAYARARHLIRLYDAVLPDSLQSVIIHTWCRVSLTSLSRRQVSSPFSNWVWVVAAGKKNQRRFAVNRPEFNSCQEGSATVFNGETLSLSFLSTLYGGPSFVGPFFGKINIPLNRSIIRFGYFIHFPPSFFSVLQNF